MAAVIQDRLKEIEGVSLKTGKHEPADGKMCVMEAAAYVAGERWSAAPQCVCPVITVFMLTWNDKLPSDADRDRLLKPLIPLIIGTSSTSEIGDRRSDMALDWIREIPSGMARTAEWAAARAAARVSAWSTEWAAAESLAWAAANADWKVRHQAHEASALTLVKEMIAVEVQS